MNTHFVKLHCASNIKAVFLRSNWKILHLAKSFYTTGGCDGCDKYEVWHIRTGAANGSEETSRGGLDPLDARLSLAPRLCPCSCPRLHPRCPWSFSSYHTYILTLLPPLFFYWWCIKAHRNVSISEKSTNYKKTSSNHCPIYPFSFFAGTESSVPEV